ncbi:MAG: ribulokinase [Clostridia bacterium]|nr:ribulokinase [Clostridia bacterium]
MAKAAIGIDFGTLSARAVVAEIGTGRELGSAALDYAHGVLDRALPQGVVLKPDWALEDPQDYIDSMIGAVREAMRQSGLLPENIVGLGLDATSCTMLPVDEAGVPLCKKDEFANCPFAWMMLWKHHGASAYAERMTELARTMMPERPARYGGRVSSEWMLPKLWQIAEEAPEVFDAADRFIEVGDWVVAQLTGNVRRSKAMAGYKAFYAGDWPDAEFLRAMHPRLARLPQRQLRGELYPMGALAGGLTREMAHLLGLNEGTPVAVANIDAHVSMPAIGTAEPGSLLMIIGTSTCHIMSGEDEHMVPGISGVVEDGVFPSAYGYEAGQSCVGDALRWYIQNGLPQSFYSEASERKLDMHTLLTEKAEKLKPGESGLLCMDWWNGNRSILVDMNLSGAIFGLTLATRPEEIYRAFIEGTAYGCRAIVDNFESHGVAVHKLYACGGIAKKNAMMMQIYADVLGRDIHIARSAQAPALGSAMFGAVAAGRSRGGYDSIGDTAREMGGLDHVIYRPSETGSRVYARLYGEYLRLHDLFGRGENDVMHTLRQIRNDARMMED